VDRIDISDNSAVAPLQSAPPEIRRSEVLGSSSRACEILWRRRALTVEMIYKIGEAWKIPADLLVQPYKVERAA
jgi:hypothetical protein